MKTYFISLATALVSIICIPVQAEEPYDILVIANMNVPRQELTEIEVRTVFLKQKQTWSSGQSIVAVNAKRGSALRRDFQNYIIEMPSSKEASYWQNQKIRQALVPPVEFSNTLKAVFSLSGAISYVYRKDFKEGVAKVLLVIPSQ